MFSGFGLPRHFILHVLSFFTHSQISYVSSLFVEAKYLGKCEYLESNVCKHEHFAAHKH